MSTCYYNSEQQEEERTTPQPTRNNIPKSIFTNRGGGGGQDSWLIGNRPLSPPLAKMDTQMPTPSMSTPHRPPWHSLWSTTTSWQPDTQQTSPIDLDFLDSPMKDTTAATDSRTGENGYFNINKSTSFIASPILRRSSYVEKKSIWDLNYPSSTFFPPAPPSISSDTSAFRDAIERRHSIAVVTQQRPITPPPQQLQIQQLIQQVQQQQKIDEFFCPTATMIDVSTLGKGMPVSQLAKHTTFYHVQFKVKYRTEFLYSNDAKIEVNDQVIVEADRGYDIGTVTAVIENTKEQRKKHKLNSDYHLKRLFRKADSEELLTFELKRQDEEKALVICQHKIKQKKLNMEVVEAEYQWDRRKLTFYFKANERIDFRELVRELFKIYKTRIWMCASSLEA